MKRSWILDIVIKDGNFFGCYDDIEGAMWFVVSVDGSRQRFSTNQVAFSEHPVWNHPARLEMHLYELGSAYIYFQLCTYCDNGNGITEIGRCRLGLRSFPLNSPKQISFPLMRVNNSSIELIQLRVKATLRLIEPKYQTVRIEPNYQYQPNGMNFCRTSPF